jgi:hypothetical protein
MYTRPANHPTPNENVFPKLPTAFPTAGSPLCSRAKEKGMSQIDRSGRPPPISSLEPA